mmetsp:Transcript_306/g.241  ORF Transcript_306/g.241 Transcript_306/m.241 type:complete len:859 (-) Transcript_306:160-2736(-)
MGTGRMRIENESVASFGSGRLASGRLASGRFGGGRFGGGGNESGVSFGSMASIVRQARTNDQIQQETQQQRVVRFGDSLISSTGSSAPSSLAGGVENLLDRLEDFGGEAETITPAVTSALYDKIIEVIKSDLEGGVHQLQQEVIRLRRQVEIANQQKEMAITVADRQAAEMKDLEQKAYESEQKTKKSEVEIENFRRQIKDTYKSNIDATEMETEKHEIEQRKRELERELDNAEGLRARLRSLETIVRRKSAEMSTLRHHLSMKDPSVNFTSDKNTTDNSSDESSDDDGTHVRFHGDVVRPRERLFSMKVTAAGDSTPPAVVAARAVAAMSCMGNTAGNKQRRSTVSFAVATDEKEDDSSCEEEDMHEMCKAAMNDSERNVSRLQGLLRDAEEKLHKCETEADVERERAETALSAATKREKEARMEVDQLLSTRDNDQAVMREAMTKLERDMVQLEEERELAGKNAAELKVQMEEIQNEKANLEAALEHSEADSLELQEKGRKLQEMMAVGEEALKMAEAELSVLRGNETDVSGSVEALKKMLQESQQKLRIAEQQNLERVDELSSEVKSLMQHLSERENDLRLAAESAREGALRREEAQKLMSETATIEEQLRMQIQDLEVRKQSLQLELERTTKRLVVVEDDLATQTATLGSLTEKLDKCQGCSESTSKQCEDVERLLFGAKVTTIQAEMGRAEAESRMVEASEMTRTMEVQRAELIEIVEQLSADTPASEESAGNFDNILELVEKIEISSKMVEQARLSAESIAVVLQTKMAQIVASVPQNTKVFQLQHVMNGQIMMLQAMCNKLMERLSVAEQKPKPSRGSERWSCMECCCIQPCTPIYRKINTYFTQGLCSGA